MQGEGHVACIRDARNVHRILFKILKVRDHLEALIFNERIILKGVLKEIGCEDVDWLHLAQDRDQWQALVTMGINLQVP
jgi:hypothetical protein